MRPRPPVGPGLVVERGDLPGRVGELVPRPAAARDGHARAAEQVEVDVHAVRREVLRQAVERPRADAVAVVAEGVDQRGVEVADPRRRPLVEHRRDRPDQLGVGELPKILGSEVEQVRRRAGGHHRLELRAEVAEVGVDAADAHAGVLRLVGVGDGVDDFRLVVVAPEQQRQLDRPRRPAAGEADGDVGERPDDEQPGGEAEQQAEGFGEGHRHGSARNLFATLTRSVPAERGRDTDVGTSRPRSAGTLRVSVANVTPQPAAGPTGSSRRAAAGRA